MTRSAGARHGTAFRHFKRDFASSFEMAGLVLVPLGFVIVLFSDLVFVVLRSPFGSFTFWLDLVEVGAAGIYSLFFITRAKAAFWRVILGINSINMFSFLLGLYLAISPHNEAGFILTAVRLAVAVVLLIFATRWWLKVRTEAKESAPNA